MPAAAVIPAPIAYIKIVAVKKLVVYFWLGARRPLRLRSVCGCAPAIFLDIMLRPSLGGRWWLDLLL